MKGTYFPLRLEAVRASLGLPEPPVKGGLLESGAKPQESRDEDGGPGSSRA